ncbi:hypothetical protein V1279_002991 [Bradyrhizobium sp. AZCC 1610]|uniref:hypothetical protein n=1 Tax=Bradyrhizobium sp. AZCC 1610 TaxID=3117020 RepID=UPI002FF289A3
MAKQPETITTTYPIIDTAMAAYIVLEDSRLIVGNTLPEDHPFKEAEMSITDWCNNFGAATMRNRAWDLSPLIENVWCSLTEKEQEDICWDFEFVPEFILYCIKFDDHSEYLKPVVDRVDALVDTYRKARSTAEEFKGSCPPSSRQRDEFIRQCKAEAVKQWAYEDLVTDDCPSRNNYTGSRMQQAFEIGEKPAEFVKWLGEKYDLTPANEWFGRG